MVRMNIDIIYHIFVTFYPEGFNFFIGCTLTKFLLIRIVYLDYNKIAKTAAFDITMNYQEFVTYIVRGLENIPVNGIALRPLWGLQRGFCSR